jgi:hypothetical protein
MFRRHRPRRIARAMTLYLPCDCGFSLVSPDFDDLVTRARYHARHVHGMELSPEQIMTLARPWAGDDRVTEPDDAGARP